MDERKHLFYAGQCDRNREKGNDFASRCATGTGAHKNALRRQSVLPHVQSESP